MCMPNHKTLVGLFSVYAHGNELALVHYTHLLGRIGIWSAFRGILQAVHVLLHAETDFNPEWTLCRVSVVSLLHQTSRVLDSSQ